MMNTVANLYLPRGLLPPNPGRPSGRHVSGVRWKSGLPSGEFSDEIRIPRENPRHSGM